MATLHIIQHKFCIGPQVFQASHAQRMANEMKPRREEIRVHGRNEAERQGDGTDEQEEEVRKRLRETEEENRNTESESWRKCFWITNQAKKKAVV